LLASLVAWHFLDLQLDGLARDFLRFFRGVSATLVLNHGAGMVRYAFQIPGGVRERVVALPEKGRSFGGDFAIRCGWWIQRMRIGIGFRAGGSRDERNIARWKRGQVGGFVAHFNVGACVV
jgi:hypothetical protein